MSGNQSPRSRANHGETPVSFVAWAWVSLTARVVSRTLKPPLKVIEPYEGRAGSLAYATTLRSPVASKRAVGSRRNMNWPEGTTDRPDDLLSG